MRHQSREQGDASLEEQLYDDQSGDNALLFARVLDGKGGGRKLDWEDHDLLRIVGQQLAVHLSAFVVCNACYHCLDT